MTKVDSLIISAKRDMIEPKGSRWNAKMLGIVGVALIGSLLVGAYGALQPVAPPKSLITAVDIQVLNVVPGVSTSTVSGQSSQSSVGVMVLATGSTLINFTSAFAFSPLKSANAINSTRLTIVYTFDSGNRGDAFSVRMNGADIGTVLEKTYQPGYPLEISGALDISRWQPGTNTIDIGIEQAGATLSQVYLYQVRLTVGYSYVV